MVEKVESGDYMSESDIEEFLSTPMKLLLIIAENDNIVQSQLVLVSKMSSSTVQKWVTWLESKGLIEVIETKTIVGSKKKIIRLTEKGKKVVDEIRNLSNMVLLTS
ncbi:MarR family transcriptional regulator [Sulfolobus tengchongensis]|uniref:MarR family transcriptional regulator n=1 Tax=Sulfolobus tengchongensis TaxID=207809 RepID=A0AAX4L2T5_9CREN